MMNYWWVTRPKRRLNSVPEVLATIADVSLNQEWQGQRGVHLNFENALEQSNLKRIGDRRDQGGGGARTYIAWISSLGLVFSQRITGFLRLTLAGEAILAGEPPVEIIANQVLKYQFPSSFSLGRNVDVAPRFKIRPFRFLLRLLSDSRIDYLKQDEIAKIIIVEAENETDACFEKVVNRILEYRDKGEDAMPFDFFTKYPPSRGSIEFGAPDPFRFYKDIANTIINWLEYTQLALRSEEDRYVRILPEKMAEVERILSETLALIDRPTDHEYFQRKYGLDPKHQKDLRNLSETKTITSEMIDSQKVKRAFISLSLKQPIGKITSELVDAVTEATGVPNNRVEEILYKSYPHGAIGAFMTEYFEMAFRGRDDATEFEIATTNLFKDVFGYEAKHVGPIGLTPDVLVVSDDEGYCGIIDNKAYSKYTISNDHKNRMIQNYIGDIARYYDGGNPLVFFSYIAGGFGSNIDTQINSIVTETDIHGSAIGVSNMIKLVELYPQGKLNHKRLREIFSVNRQVTIKDFD